MAEVVRSLSDQLERYGFKSVICVEPQLFGKDPDHTRTAFFVRKWMEKNLRDLWDVKIVRRVVWTKDAGYFEITCMSEYEMGKVNDFFNYPKV